MLNVTYCVEGEYDDYFSLCMTKEQYKLLNQFVQNFNENVEHVSIKVLKIENTK